MARHGELDRSLAVISLEAEKVVHLLIAEVSNALRLGDHAKANLLIKRVETVRNFLEFVAEIQSQDNLVSILRKPTTKIKQQRTYRGRQYEGVQKQSAFKVPLLQAIVELGGSGKIKDIEKIVERKMKPQLAPLDYKPTGTYKTRWQHKVHWLRYDFVIEGLLSSRSPSGIWEISDLGRDWLKRNS